MQLEVGQILSGRVTGIKPFGAFVELPNGKNGLVHISEIADSYVREVRDHLSENQEVRVRVIGISPEGKISLSIRKAAEDAPAAPRPVSAGRTAPRPRAPGSMEAAAYVPQPSGDRSFEDKLKRFMQESDGKMSGNKLYQQSKRGQRRRK